MLKLLIAIVAVALVYWLYRQRRTIFVRSKRPEPVITTIEATEIRAYLAWNTPVECLREDATRHGPNFQSKQPPELPHASGCRCEKVSLFYTSADVFQGASEEALRNSELGSLSPLEANRLKMLLLAIRDATLPESLEELLTEYPLDPFEPARREEVRRLLQKAWDDVQASPQETAPESLSP